MCFQGRARKIFQNVCWNLYPACWAFILYPDSIIECHSYPLVPRVAPSTTIDYISWFWYYFVPVNLFPIKCNFLIPFSNGFNGFPLEKEQNFRQFCSYNFDIYLSRRLVGWSSVRSFYRSFDWLVFRWPASYVVSCAGIVQGRFFFSCVN